MSLVRTEKSIFISVRFGYRTMKKLFPDIIFIRFRFRKKTNNEIPAHLCRIN